MMGTMRPNIQFFILYGMANIFKMKEYLKDQIVKLLVNVAFEIPLPVTY